LIDADSGIQIGLVSFGAPCDNPDGRAEGFTRVDTAMDFIRSYIDNDRDDSYNPHGNTSPKPWIRPEYEVTEASSTSRPFPFLG
jgi:hypothetical protein